jgi:hypothetical protein
MPSPPEEAMTDYHDPFIAPVCWFDIPTVDDRVVKSGAIYVEHFPIPVVSPVRDPYVGGGIIGKIDSYEITDGVMTVLGYADRSALPTDEDNNPIYTVGMDLNMIETAVENDLLVFTRARLMAISVINRPAFEAAKMRFD